MTSSYERPSGSSSAPSSDWLLSNCSILRCPYLKVQLSVHVVRSHNDSALLFKPFLACRASEKVRDDWHATQAVRVRVHAGPPDLDGIQVSDLDSDSDVALDIGSERAKGIY